jgi:broad specificity phosphatase PhoE
MQATKRLLANPLKTKLTNNLNETNLIIIRHAESMFNYELNKVRALKEDMNIERWEKLRREVKFNDSLIDCGLTDKGIEQCLKAGEELSQFNFTKFIVSPLKRNLLTCYNLLHSISKSNNKFYRENKTEIIVNPYIYERIEDSCDFIKDIYKTMKEFSFFDNNGLKIPIDWKQCLLDSHLPIYQLMYCDMVITEDLVMKRKELHYYQKELESYKKYKKYTDFKDYLAIMDKLEEHHGYAIESNVMTMSRLVKFKEDLGKFNKDEKILVVGHSELFRHLLASNVDEGMNPVERTVIGNCEVVGIKFI